MKKKALALLMAASMVLGLTACGGGAAAPAADSGSKDEAADSGSSGGGDLIKVGIINNDPNESGYRTANDKDLKETFSAANGYDASFAYSLKNDEQITAAQKFIQDGVDYLLLSAADTSGWDSVLKDAQDAGIQVILFDRTIDADPSLYAASIVSDMDKEGQTAVDWLASQNLSEYNVIHIQGVMGSAAQKGRSGALDAKVLDKANISHGVGKDVIVMGFDCNKWALEELLNQNWNYDGQCNPFQSSYISDVIKTLESGKTPDQKTIIMDEKGFDATTITKDDVDKYGI